MNLLPKASEAGKLPEGYPAATIESVNLQDGTLVTLRPIRPDDAPRLQASFRRLSAQSVYLRFLESFKELSDRQAQELASVDYADRMAFVAEAEENGQKSLIGVARYAMIGPSEPGVAESAIVVMDEYQKRGLGTILLDRLVKFARTHGVVGFLATVHLSNTPILRFIQRSNFPFEKRLLEPGVWEIRIWIRGID